MQIHGIDLLFRLEQIRFMTILDLREIPACKYRYAFSVFSKYIVLLRIDIQNAPNGTNFKLQLNLNIACFGAYYYYCYYYYYYYY